MSQPIETYRGVVYPWHCDHMGHMNVMWYVGKFDEATWQLFAMLGLTRQWLTAHHRGMAAVDQRIAYQRELRAGDTVIVHSVVLELRPRVITFAHRMLDAVSGEVCATTRLVGAHLDTQLRRATAFAPEVAERASRLTVKMELPWDASRDQGAA